MKSELGHSLTNVLFQDTCVVIDFREDLAKLNFHMLPFSELATKLSGLLGMIQVSTSPQLKSIMGEAHRVEGFE